MTREERLRMLLHPDQYTDEQLAQMLDETDIATPDAAEEWQRFKAKKKETVIVSPPKLGGAGGGLNKRQEPSLAQTTPNPSYLRRGDKMWWFRIAAAFIGMMLIVSGISYAAVHIATADNADKVEVVGDRKPDVKKVKKTYGVEVAPTKKAPVIYNNVELQQIMQYLADAYNVKVEFRNEQARTIRFYLQWEADDTLQEIIDRINHFEKVHLTLTDETITIE